MVAHPEFDHEAFMKNIKVVKKVSSKLTKENEMLKQVVRDRDETIKRIKRGDGCNCCCDPCLVFDNHLECTHTPICRQKVARDWFWLTVLAILVYCLGATAFAIWAVNTWK